MTNSSKLVAMGLRWFGIARQVPQPSDPCPHMVLVIGALRRPLISVDYICEPLPLTHTTAMCRSGCLRPSRQRRTRSGRPSSACITSASLCRYRACISMLML